MIYLPPPRLETKQDARQSLQLAIGVEFGTLPPYLYALYTIAPGTNPEASRLIRTVVLEEMVHMCLACNILNALGGDPLIQVQHYPGPLPGDIGPPGEGPLWLHLYRFSPEAMDQGMKIEKPVDAPNFPVTGVGEPPPTSVTIGQFYALLDRFLSTLPADDWMPNRNQLSDTQFFSGQIFAVNNYADAKRAIEGIVSEGEGSRQSTKYDPLDFQGDVAHYFRFGEIFNNKVLTKTETDPFYTFGPTELGVDWAGAYPAIKDPATHNFSLDPPAAQVAQQACNQAFSAMIDRLQLAVRGRPGALGEAVRYMFDLRLAALHAMTVPLADGVQVAGPAFQYVSPVAGGDRA